MKRCFNGIARTPGTQDMTLSEHRRLQIWVYMAEWDADNFFLSFRSIPRLGSYTHSYYTHTKNCCIFVASKFHRGVFSNEPGQPQEQNRNFLERALFSYICDVRFFALCFKMSTFSGKRLRGGPCFSPRELGILLPQAR